MVGTGIDMEYRNSDKLNDDYNDNRSEEIRKESGFNHSQILLH